MDAQISEIVETAVSNLSKVAEVNTIIGKPLITMDGTTVLPVSQINFAFMAGGGEYGNGKSLKRENNSNFAGGSGGGASLTPVCFLIINKDGVKVLDTEKSNTLEKIFDVAKDLANTFKKD
ncbi:MAG: hypothetical protein NC099_02660 [Corallococcus sp.]|nr:sporulation protein YtfJ [Bacillota bacterium]MCM1533534.1 hypothetical protein [Corallococcus sp.]